MPIVVNHSNIKNQFYSVIALPTYTYIFCNKTDRLKQTGDSLVHFANSEYLFKFGPQNSLDMNSSGNVATDSE